jgi:DNA polymerase III alpha subunit (gram-positive type)
MNPLLIMKLLIYYFIRDLYTFISFLIKEPIRFIYNIFNNNTLMGKSRLIFYDFETTGLNPYHDKIIEYCFIEDADNMLQSLVNPYRKFDYFITQLTGIHPEELEKHVGMNIHMTDIIDFLEKDPKNTSIYLVAHNNDGFDKLFLKNIIKKYGQDYYKVINRDKSSSKYNYIDTLLLAKKIKKTKSLKRFSLKELTKYYNITTGTHRAESDTLSLKELYYKLVEDLSYELDDTYDRLIQNPKLVYDYLYD